MRTHHPPAPCHVSAAGVAIACEAPPPSNALTASGNVEATEVQVAAEVGGRIVELRVDEGDRVKAGDVIATLDTKDIELQIDRARAERAAAPAQLRLLEAGARVEDVRQAEAQVDAATSEIAAIDVEIEQRADRPRPLRGAAQGQRRVAEAARRRQGPRGSGARAEAQRRGTRARGASRRSTACAPARARKSSTAPGRAWPPWTRRWPCSTRACATRRSCRSVPAAWSRRSSSTPASWCRRARRSSSSPISITPGPTCSCPSRWCRGSRSGRRRPS